MKRPRELRGPRAPRREFLRRVLALLAVPVVGTFDLMVRRAGVLPENAHRTVSVPLPATNGLHLYPEMLVVNRDGRIAVFSSACTHLGCRIDRADGDELACPCHGSRFALDGGVVRGPAARGLRSLPYDIDRAQAVIRVRLDS